MNLSNDIIPEMLYARLRIIYIIEIHPLALSSTDFNVHKATRAFTYLYK